MAGTSPTLLDFAVGIGLAAFVVMPAVSLLHELGHAFVALRVGPGVVQVRVGRPPGLRLDAGRLRIGFNLIPAKGVSFAGLCIRERVSSDPRKELLVLLAGPVVSLLAAAVLSVLALQSINQVPSWLTLTLVFGALNALVSFLSNVDPRPTSAREKERRHIVRDGPQAATYYRRWRAGERTGGATAPDGGGREEPEPERPISVAPPSKPRP